MNTKNFNVFPGGPVTKAAISQLQICYIGMYFRDLALTIFSLRRGRVCNTVSTRRKATQTLTPCHRHSIGASKLHSSVMYRFHEESAQRVMGSPDSSIQAHTRTRLAACASGNGQTGSLHGPWNLMIKLTARFDNNKGVLLKR